MSSGDSVLRIAHLYPTVLGLYGDRGNALVLAHRARLRGIAVEIVEVAPGEPVPRTCDVYHLGGGEDLAQTTAAELLRADGGLAAAVGRGAVVLSISAFSTSRRRPGPCAPWASWWPRRSTPCSAR